MKRLAVLLLAGLVLAACSAPAQEPDPPEKPAVEQPRAEGQKPAVEQSPAENQKATEGQKPKEKGTQPVTGVFEKRQLKQGEPLPGPGIYFVSTADGTVEGWSPLAGTHGVTYSASDDNRFVGVQVDRSNFLIDRQSGSVSATNGWLAAARAGRLLMAEPLEGSANLRYFVLDADQNLVSRFELPRWGAMGSALISPDGSRGMIATFAQEGGKALLYLVNLIAGQADLVVDLSEALGDMRIHSADLTEIPGTDEVLLVVSGYRQHPPGEPGLTSLLLRLDWQGKKRFEKQVQGSQMTLSPDGKHLFWQTDVAGYPGAVVVGDLEAEPLFRAKVFSPSVHWTTDSSGILINDMGTYKKVTLAGQVAPLAVCATLDCRPGVTPTPDNPNLYLIGQTRVVSARGEVVANVKLAPAQLQTGRIAPWGESSKELRVLVEPARGGDGWDGSAWALPVHVERPPFDDRLVVKGTGDCLNLRERPELNARVLACVPDGTPLTVTPNDTRDRTSLLGGEGGPWVYVKTEKGEIGWASIGSGYVQWYH